MPRTRFQSFIFTLIMVFCMVYVMTCYVIVRNMGGLSYSVFWIALREMWIEYPIVFVLIFYLYFRSGEMLPVYIALLVFNVIIFLINLRSFFVSRKK